MDDINNGYIDQLYKINQLYESGELSKERYEYEKDNLKAKTDNRRYVAIYDSMDRGINLKTDGSDEEIIAVKDFKESKRIYVNKTLVRFFNTDYVFDGKPGFEIRINNPGIYYYDLANISKNIKPIKKDVFFYINKVISSTIFKTVIIGVVIFCLMDQCFKENAKEAANPENKIERHFSKFDGSYIKFREYIKSNLKNPSSFEHVETRYKDNNDGTVTVWMKYRAKNSFNAVVTEIAKCTLNINTGDFSEVVTE